MRKRNYRIRFRLNEKEADYLNKRVKRSGLSREAYLRQLINRLDFDDAPPPDYSSLAKKLHTIGINLNQVAQKAHILNVIDVRRYNDSIANFEIVTSEIVDAVMLAREFRPNKEQGGEASVE